MIVKSALEHITIEQSNQFTRIEHYCIETLTEMPLSDIYKNSAKTPVSDIQAETPLDRTIPTITEKDRAEIMELHDETIAGYRKLGTLLNIELNDTAFIINIIEFYSLLCAYVFQSRLIHAGINKQTATKVVIDTSLIILLNT
jgi:hypothetical protein